MDLLGELRGVGDADDALAGAAPPLFGPGGSSDTDLFMSLAATL